MKKKKTRRQKQEDFKRRYDAIKNLMSTFTMGTIAVVAVVTLIPASPKAEIIKATPLIQEVAYQVNVTDEDNALDLSSLFVVLENQLEYYEEAIELGENSGYFNGLKEDTKYRLSVYGNKGFGQERLDTMFVTTVSKEGGTILSVETPPDLTDTYVVNLSINDPTDRYSSLSIYYGFEYEPDDEINYTQVEVTQDQVALLTPHYNARLHIYLEATTESGTEVLDEIWILPEFNLYLYPHIKYINNNQMALHIYEDNEVDLLGYTVTLYKEELLIKTFIPDIVESAYSGTDLIIGNLKSEETYQIELTVTYKNPYTLRTEEKVCFNEVVTTSADYTYSYEVIETNGIFEYTITLYDPYNVFQQVYVETSDNSTDYPQYHTSNTYMLVEDGENKSVTFTVDPTDLDSYLIEVILQNQVDFDVKQIIEVRKN